MRGALQMTDSVERPEPGHEVQIVVGDYDVVGEADEVFCDGAMTIVFDTSMADAVSELRNKSKEGTVVYTGSDARYLVPVRIAEIETVPLPVVSLFARFDQANRQQRRAHFRTAACVQVEYIARSDAGLPGARKVLATTRDISGGGALLEVKSPEAEGAEINVQLALPDGGEPLVVDARVVRSTEDGKGRPVLGIQFIGVEPRQESRLVRFVVREQARRVG